MVGVGSSAVATAMTLVFSCGAGIFRLHGKPPIVRYGGALFASLVALVVVITVGKLYNRDAAPPTRPATGPSGAVAVRPEAAPERGAAHSPEDALGVALNLNLGVGRPGEKHIAKVAARYGVSVEAVGDKAAKAAELCLASSDRVRAQPGKAVVLASAALAFVAKASHAQTDAKKEMLPIDEAFATYVAVGCPK